jgi:4'-phosphopantetheinyl transferase
VKIMADEVHVWQSDLVVSPDRLERLLRTLSTEELSRAHRIAPTAGRERFIATRGLLRELLGRYLDTPPDRVSLDYEELGKPCLSDPAPLHFNVSHAEERALFAFTTVGPLGVDLERLRSLSNVERIARRAFTPNDLQSWLQLSHEERLVGFFERWTRMEALAKLKGHGVWRLLAESGERPGHSIQYHSLEVPEGLLATLALEHRDDPIRVLHFSA